MARHTNGSGILAAPVVRLAIALVCLTTSACFRYARIERQSSGALEARIDRSTSETIFVTTSEGQEEAIHRSDVVEIGHPGKARLATGALILAGGAGLLTYGLVHQPCRRDSDVCDYSGKTMAIVVAAPLLAAGIALAMSGGITYGLSVAAAKPSSDVLGAQAMRHALPRLTCAFCAH